MWDIAVVGGGPAGLGAGIEAAKKGAKVLVIDENQKPGGQLFKQIHKFFGSKEHFAGMRGFQIGERLLKEALEAGVVFWSDTICEGFDENRDLVLKRNGKLFFEQSKKVILATGGIEKGLPFEGWTLPGVMTAGCAQTFANVRGIRVGKRALVIGTGNVGLIVAYQMMQSGMEIAGFVEVQEKIGGYDVHLKKLMKVGVPLNLRHTIKKAIGNGKVESAVIENIDSGEKKVIEVDTILLAVGLKANSRLSIIAGCNTIRNEKFGGIVPIHNNSMETTKDNVLVAGDICGIEEASTALDEGRLAGLSAARSLGFAVTQQEIEEINNRLIRLRMGPFGEERQTFKEFIMEEAEKSAKIHA